MYNVRDYNYYTRGYNAVADRYNLYTKDFGLNNPYISDYSLQSNHNVADLMSNFTKTYDPLPVEKKRGALNRILDAINVTNYATAGFVKGFFDEELSPFEGFSQGLRASNPFGKGHEDWEYSYTDVLDTMGWKPTTLGGKVARGAVGLVGDIFLDPGTYVTGGLSALVKGSGKASATAIGATAKLADTLGDTAKAVDATGDAFKSAGMTLDMAKEIVKRSRFADVMGDSVDIVTEAEKLMKKYNKAIGINDAVSDVTLSLGNVPFAKTLFGGLADKSVTLIDSDTIKKVGDSTIAPIYSKLRDSIYGTHLGKLFSTKSELYKLSKTNPDEFFNFIKKAEFDRGTESGRMVAELLIRENAKKYDLTPAQTKEVLELMEDKSTWKKVQETVKFFETKEAKIYKNKVEMLRADTAKQLDELLEGKKIISDLDKANDAKILEGNKVIEVLKEEYKRGLAKLDNKHVVEIDQFENALKAYTDESNRIKLESENLINHNNIVQAEGISDSRFKAIKRDIKKNGFVEYKREFYANAFHEKHLDWEKVVTETGEIRFYPPTSTSTDYFVSYIQNLNKSDSIDSISKYLFGKEGFISKDIYNSSVDDLLDLIKEGKSREEIVDYIFANSDVYSGKAKVMYSYIGEQLGYGGKNRYKNWKEMYHDPMNELKQKRLSGGLTKAERERMLDLEKLNMARNDLIREFSNADSAQDVLDIISQKQNLAFDRSYADTVREISVAKSKDLKNIDDYADTYTGGIRKRYHRLSESSDNVYGYAFTSENKANLFDHLMTSYNKTETKYMKQRISYAERVVDEVESLLNTVFKRDYSDLTDAQLKKLIYMAEERAKNPVSSILKTTAKEDAKELIKESQSRIKDAHKSFIQNNVKDDSYVRILHNGKQVDGIVHQTMRGLDGSKMYKVTLEGGASKTVKADSIVGILGRRGNIELSDLVSKSDIVSDFTMRQDDLDKAITSLKGDLKDLKVAQRKELADFKADLARRSELAKKDLVRFEETREHYGKVLASMEVNEVAPLRNKLQELDRALSSDDAFESYLRMQPKIGDETVDRIIDLYNPNAGMYILDERLDVSDRVKEVVHSLRQSFVTMGEEEVFIRSLSQEQLDSMMYNYLPHVLTPEGEKFLAGRTLQEVFDSSDEIRYIKDFNPFAQSRTIKSLPDGKGGWIENPTVSQINDFFRDKLQGKNLFSENVADIYLARALKHNELMYNHEYMHNMLEMFGKDYTGVLEDGFSVVMNNDMLRNYSSEVSRRLVNLDISDALTDYLDDPSVLGSITEYVDNAMKTYTGSFGKYERKRLFNEKIAEVTGEFLKQNFTQEIRNKMFDEHLEVFLDMTGTKSMLDELSMPLSEMTDLNIKPIRNSFDEVYNRSLSNITGRAVEVGVGSGKKTKYKGGLVSIAKQIFFDTHGVSMPDSVAESITKLDANGIRREVDRLRKLGDELDNVRLDSIIEKLDSLQEFSKPQIKQVNNAIVSKANQARKLQIAKDQSRFLQLYDKFTHFIKLSQTAILPSFHARNKQSNIFNNWLEVGSDAWNVDFQKNAYTALVNNGDPSKVTGVLDIVTSTGEKSSITWSELYDMAKRYGVVDEGYFAKDIGDVSTTGLFKGFVKKGYDPTDMQNFIPYVKGAEIGSIIENQDRLVHFASQVSRGMSFADASESVNKFLFDYSDLTAFEMSVMKRIMPYYTWLRKNSALQLDRMLETPEKYKLVSKVMGGIESMVSKDQLIDKTFVNEFAQDWVQTPFSVRNPEGRTEPVLWNPNLPFMDIGRIPDPFNLKDSMKEMFTQTNPMIKTPIEQIMNRNVFFDSPIVRSEETALKDRAKHVFSQHGAYPMIEGFVQKDGLDLALHTLNSTAGVKLLSYDYDKYKAMKIQELLDNDTKENKDKRKRKKEIKKAIKRRLR